MSLARRLLKTLTYPIRRILDPRFHDVTHRISQSRQEIGALDARVGAVATTMEQRVLDVTAAQVETLAAVGQELRGATGEIAAINRGLTALEQRVMGLTLEDHERSYRERMARATGGALEQLDQQGADLINYAASHRGFAAQAGLWLNPPVVLEHRAESVRVSTVNERIVELPFAMRALGDVPIGARVLDFGSAESQVSLSLASLGYRVTALDLTAYPFTHPGLEAVRSPLEQWDAEPGSFDAALVISTVEHVGLGWYGEPAGAYDDLRAMARIRELVRPGGVAVLTVPYGTATVTDVQRVYDRAGLDDLLQGFDVTERLIVEEQDGRWIGVEESTEHAVALVAARVPDA